MTQNKAAGERFGELLDVMARLRGEKGCPWDKEQTHASLKTSLLSETYELLDAIDRDEPEKMRDELGDLLHQIVFHCQIAAERGEFSAPEVVTELKEKMIRRHPHVFSEQPLPDSGAVLKQWFQIKAKEKEERQAKSSLGDLPKAMPALARAQRITERASHVGFDWPNAEPVWQKIEEELAELKSASSSGNKRRIEEEMGDLLFSLVNLSRFFGIEAEDTLGGTVERFIRRFSYIEDKLREAGKSLATSSLEEMDALWDQAKKLERQEQPAK
ncbi:MAG TPA: nucleoside triphosphate pyrophosphohydrolase [Candidatus Binatia bacterium]|nr:nucleoside triphosphate pyrophosphohydrolase [Candidatus Binatia bacterium]